MTWREISGGTYRQRGEVAILAAGLLVLVVHATHEVRGAVEGEGLGQHREVAAQIGIESKS